MATKRSASQSTDLTLTKQQSANKAKLEVVENDQAFEPSIAVIGNFAAPSGFKMKKVLTVPSLVLKEVGMSAVLRVDTELRVSNVAGKEGEKPATICNVTKMDTGEQFIFLVPAVVASVFTQEYEENDYVGKTFYIQNLGKKEGSDKRYKNYGVAEVEAD